MRPYDSSHALLKVSNTYRAVTSQQDQLQPLGFAGDDLDPLRGLHNVVPSC